MPLGSELERLAAEICARPALGKGQRERFTRPAERQGRHFAIALAQPCAEHNASP